MKIFLLFCVTVSLVNGEAQYLREIKEPTGPSDVPEPKKLLGDVETTPVETTTAAVETTTARKIIRVQGRFLREGFGEKINGTNVPDKTRKRKKILRKRVRVQKQNVTVAEPVSTAAPVPVFSPVPQAVVIQTPANGQDLSGLVQQTLAALSQQPVQQPNATGVTQQYFVRVYPKPFVNVEQSVNAPRPVVYQSHVPYVPQPPPQGQLVYQPRLVYRQPEYAPRPNRIVYPVTEEKIPSPIVVQNLGPTNKLPQLQKYVVPPGFNEISTAATSYFHPAPAFQLTFG